MATAYPDSKPEPNQPTPTPWVAQMATNGKSWEVVSYVTTPATKVAQGLTRADAELIVSKVN